MKAGISAGKSLLFYELKKELPHFVQMRQLFFLGSEGKCTAETADRQSGNDSDDSTDKDLQRSVADEFL